jgi:ABC-type glutathione transport system ATPase component
MIQTDKLLQIEELVLYFNTTHGPVQAVDGVNFELNANRAVVILGESGCGKSSLAKAILRLLPRNVGTYAGHIYLLGQDIMALSEVFHLDGASSRHECFESCNPGWRTGG